MGRGGEGRKDGATPELDKGGKERVGGRTVQLKGAGGGVQMISDVAPVC